MLHFNNLPFSIHPFRHTWLTIRLLFFLGLFSLMPIPLLAKSLIVKATPSSTSIQSSLFPPDVVIVASLTVPKQTTQSLPSIYYEIEIPDHRDDLMATIQQLPNVVSIEPNHPIYLRGFTDFSDSLRNTQYYLNNPQIMAILEVIPTRSVLVAVVDTGFSPDHPDLIGKGWVNSAEIPNGIDDDQNGYVDDQYGYDFYQSRLGGRHNITDQNGHGTHISGIIAANVNNQQGIIGLAPMAKILPIKIFSADGFGYQFDAAAGILYAIQQGADVINCSWGYSQVNTVLADAIQAAIDASIWVVASAGNSGTGSYEYPASLPGVISVGSLNSAGNRSYFTNKNSLVDVYISGENIVSTGLSNGYWTLDGTSQSASVISGLLAHYLAAFPRRIPLSTALFSPVQTPSGEWLPQIMSAHHLISNHIPTANLTISMATGGYDSTHVAIRNQTEPVFQIQELIQYPNPLKDGPAYFSFYSPDQGLGTISLYSVFGQFIGRHVFQVVAGSNKTAWQLLPHHHLPRGTYLFVLEIKTTQRTMIERGKLTVLR